MHYMHAKQKFPEEVVKFCIAELVLAVKEVHEVSPFCLLSDKDHTSQTRFPGIRTGQELEELQPLVEAGRFISFMPRRPSATVQLVRRRRQTLLVKVILRTPSILLWFSTSIPFNTATFRLSPGLPGGPTDALRLLVQNGMTPVCLGSSCIPLVEPLWSKRLRPHMCFAALRNPHAVYSEDAYRRAGYGLVRKDSAAELLSATR